MCVCARVCVRPKHFGLLCCSCIRWVKTGGVMNMHVSVSPACTPEVRGLRLAEVWYHQPQKQPAVGQSPDHTRHREHALARSRLPNVGEDSDIRRSASFKTPHRRSYPLPSISQIPFCVKAWEAWGGGRSLDLNSENAQHNRGWKRSPTTLPHRTTRILSVCQC